MNFSELVTSSVLTRALALFVLFAVMIAAIVIAAHDLLIGQPIPPDILSLLTLGLGYALTILGLNFGVRLSEPPHASAQTAEATPAQEGDATNGATH